MKLRYTILAAPLLALAFAPSAHAQSIAITPAVGVYFGGEDVEDLQQAGEQVTLDKEATLGLGLNVELGWLRGSLAYASGATINAEGDTEGEIGEGSMLMAAADVVLRPIPRILTLQPYLLGGAGLKRTDYDWETEGTDAFPSGRSDFTLHVGVGADIMFGRLGVMVELSDYISEKGDDRFGRHDAFLMTGLRLGL